MTEQNTKKKTAESAPPKKEAVSWGTRDPAITEKSHTQKKEN
jgi:hypothetical protein